MEDDEATSIADVNAAGVLKTPGGVRAALAVAALEGSQPTVPGIVNPGSFVVEVGPVGAYAPDGAAVLAVDRVDPAPEPIPVHIRRHPTAAGVVPTDLHDGPAGRRTWRRPTQIHSK